MTDINEQSANMQSRVRLGDFNTAGFNRGAGKLKEISWYLIKMVFFLSAFPFPSSIKTTLLKLFGAKIGSGVNIKPRVNIHFPWKLEIGNDVWIGEEVFILNFEKTVIGNNACISQRAFLCGGNHDFKQPSMPYRNGPITLMDGAWVGASCFVGPGVTIGTDSVITAGSIVTGSIEANGIYRGNPAVFIKNRWAA
ncbi:WcaF family extracellular polysaccharide biosynthesis acetyltransferase [Mucilaginibacter terrae]|uniref:Colanic acid biosynthesis acetyltransferase WcaF n=1 Tax=Mucilaginibacter terrae TaxID=1955052 RepID=A0ABU3GZC9_9SPHI|nr:WcaF family extracellular polysaccharide biosynthesis acetyltransferase [Mucilaginibacter terrae]MDT3404796.1 putative colanic acid biosynthesis acetyltransferase WcaF [Mucilaginibacter terrae]